MSPDQTPTFVHRMRFRVRYSEVDRMGTFYNARALEWFEAARVEYLRAVDLPYDRMEADGVHLPLIEAHLDFRGRAGFDDLLEMSVSGRMVGKARVRFDMDVCQADDPDRRVVSGYTVHAVTTRDGRPIRGPQWLAEGIAPPAGERKTES